MTLLAARKYLFSDISETNKFLLCVFPLILFFRKCEFVPVVLIMALAFCECHHVMMTFCFCMIFFPGISFAFMSIDNHFKEYC